MDILLENWGLILISLVLIVSIGFVTYKFFTQPSEKRKEQIRIVLLELVIQAESYYGSKTGKIKFSAVYGQLLERFNWLKFVPLSVVEVLVEESLEEMHHLLETNPKVAEKVLDEDASANG